MLVLMIYLDIASLKKIKYWPLVGTSLNVYIAKRRQKYLTENFHTGQSSHFNQIPSLEACGCFFELKLSVCDIVV